jgi:hypothetical protein
MLLDQQPFRPFRMQLSNGMTHEVRHPEMTTVQLSVVWVYYPAVQIPIPLAERDVVVTLAHIVQVDFIQPPFAATN